MNSSKTTRTILSKLLNDIFTGKDNNTFTPDRIFGAIGFIVLLILSFLKYHSTTFNELSMGLIFYLTGWCIGVVIKMNAEPKADPKKENDNGFSDIK